MAATIAKDSEFPFIKLISPDGMVGMADIQKVVHINKIFEDAYKSPLSVIVIDQIERLIGLSRLDIVGHQCSNQCRMGAHRPSI